MLFFFKWHRVYIKGPLCLASLQATSLCTLIHCLMEEEFRVVLVVVQHFKLCLILLLVLFGTAGPLHRHWYWSRAQHWASLFQSKFVNFTAQGGWLLIKLLHPLSEKEKTIPGCPGAAVSGWSDFLNNDVAVWLPLTPLLNSAFRFRPSKSLSPYWSTPDSYFTPSNNILQLLAINSHDIWIEREKGKHFEGYESIFPLFLYRTYIKWCVWPGRPGLMFTTAKAMPPLKHQTSTFSLS